MRLLGLVLLCALLATCDLAFATTPVKGLGAQPATEAVAGADADGIWRFYRAAPIQRTLARRIAVLSAASRGLRTCAKAAGGGQADEASAECASADGVRRQTARRSSRTGR